MRTVNIELVWLDLYIFCGLGTFEEVAANYLHHVGVKRVQRRRKTFRVHLSGFAIVLIEDVLMFLAERSRFTGLGKLFQLVGSSIG